MPVCILQQGACTLAEIETAAREVKEREGQLDAVIIDHSGLVVSDRSSTAYERASANAIGTKQLARRLDTVVGSIVQANCGAAKDTERAPAALESARDSGC